jgi:hydrogenase maturation protein HypF
MTAGTVRHRITVTGVVQGVGYRPFVHRLATGEQLTGFVGNDARSVFIEVQGPEPALKRFERRLRGDAPPLAVVADVRAVALPTVRGDRGFAIVESVGGAGVRAPVPPDIATCDACLRDLNDPADRRYRHPFVTCTDCGPRFSIIRALPYDRPATTMARFPMCPTCAGEYANPADRRFHAQPISCPDCGPVLRFEQNGQVVTGDRAIAAAQRGLAAGQVIAIKGIGGYHLACRADADDAVRRLRARKARDQKPFAVLVRDLDVARRLALIDADAARILTGAARPIVLLRRRPAAEISDAVAPGNPLLGLLLPYTPLHHLLLAAVPGVALQAPEALVLTSANLSDEPLCFDDTDAVDRLPGLCDGVLTHDRPIHVPVDDSVVRVVDGHELPIRRSRGYAPLPVRLGRELPTVLAVGGELKNTCCLIDGDSAFCSAHIGDMGSPVTTRAFERAAAQLGDLRRARPAVLAADCHPAYLTRRWAEEHAGAAGEPGLELVQHHHAHLASLLAEHARIGTPVTGVVFDGTGYGDDGTIWGGEFLVLGADTASYRRAGHLLPVHLPGGDAAVRNPCRVALAYLAAADVAWTPGLPPVDACTAAELSAVRAQLGSATASVRCSSMGRFFDAVASLLGVRHRIGYEAQAAIELEQLADSAPADPAAVLPAFDIGAGNILDHRPVVRGIVAGLHAGVPTAVLARGVHVAVAEAVTEVAYRIACAGGSATVGLTGGVFQNVVLLGECTRRLRERGLLVLTHRLVPPNDAGLALGQAVVAALRTANATPLRRSPASGGPTCV